MRAVGIGDDQLRALGELADDPVEVVIGEAGVAGEHHVAGAVVGQVQAACLGIAVQGRGAVERHGGTGRGLGQVVQAGGAGQEDALGRDGQVQGAQAFAERFGRVGGIVAEEMQAFAGVVDEGPGAGQDGLSGDQAAVQVAEEGAVAVEVDPRAQPLLGAQPLLVVRDIGFSHGFLAHWAASSSGARAATAVGSWSE